MPSAETARERSRNRLVIRNIGLLLSGDIARPTLDADTIVADHGRIVAVGREADVDASDAATIIDANGIAVVPGLIDSHMHPVAGDWSPRQNQIGWIDSCLHGGVTTMISAGEVQTPGRPRDIVGLKALAIASQRMFANFRPSGVKVHAGAPVIEAGMTEDDFREMAEAGVTLLGEVGLGSVKDGPTARTMVAWARKYGMKSTIHAGGDSIPGSGLIDKDVILAADTDVIAHINGGPTALSDAQITTLCRESSRALEIVHNGNQRAALHVLKAASELDQLHRVLVGTDAPAGSGVQPLGILRMITYLASVGGVAPEIAVCFATGNTARVHELDCGIVALGRAADFVLIDTAMGSFADTVLASIALGDLPGIAMTIIDGEIRTHRSRNTPPSTRVPAVTAH